MASGLTTVGGFSVLMLSEFVILKDFGLMTVINILLALLSTFIILPPILSICDRFLLSKKEKEEAENASIEIIHEI
ncbi:efflux transporter, putative, hydrophobe/amphiphile efflux-3 (HAE3) family [Clostridioides difficile]|nr:efflux transporter, putative, hydrophobe/amphiphile efflux-3 (HAE3) family [Clostridioides difficile]